MNLSDFLHSYVTKRNSSLKFISLLKCWEARRYVEIVNTFQIVWWSQWENGKHIKKNKNLNWDSSFEPITPIFNDEKWFFFFWILLLTQTATEFSIILIDVLIEWDIYVGQMFILENEVPKNINYKIYPKLS